MFEGLTRQGLRRLWSLYHEIKIEDMKFQVRLAGGKVNEDEDGNFLSDEEIAMKLIDPLHGFPDDIKYLKYEQIMEHEKFSTEQYAKHVIGDIKLTDKQIVCLWNEDRVSAALNTDKSEEAITARRAAHVDALWYEYKTWRDKTGKCSLDRLRWFIERDLALREMYPVSDEGIKLLEARNMGHMKRNEPMEMVDPDKPPPEWWIDHLKAKGQFEKFKEAVHQVMMRKVED